jgi:predicted ribosomally synthesized peptide with SipW-like signal peptide
MIKDNRLNVTRRKALAGLGTIGAASAGAGLGTSAFFSDTEEFQNNQLTAGELDMKVAWQSHYVDWLGDEADDAHMPGSGETPSFRLPAPADLPDAQDIELVVSDGQGLLRGSRVQREYGGLYPGGSNFDDLCGTAADVPDDQAVISLDDVKPGDFGFGLFRFQLCTNPGFVWLTGDLVSESENGVNEPEADDPDEDQTQDGTPKSGVNEPEVELLDAIQVAYGVGTTADLSADQPANLFPDPDPNSSVPQPRRQASLREFLTGLGTGAGIPLAGNIPASDGGGMGRQCFSGLGDDQTADEHYVSFVWWLPIDHGNQVQSDSVTFDFGFYTEQCRHNDGGGTGESVPDAVSISAAPDTAGSTDSVHRVEIPVGSALDGETLSSLAVDYPADFDISGVDPGDVIGAGIQRTDNSITSIPVSGTSSSDGGTAVEFTLGGGAVLGAGETIFIEYRDTTNASTPDDYTVVVDINGGEIGPGTLTITPDSGTPQPSISTFDTDEDGWEITGDAQGGSAVPDYESGRGNPAPSISATDDVQGGTWYFKAPGKFLTDKSDFYGGTLEYDLLQEFSGSPSQFNNDDIVLSGGGMTLVYDHGGTSSHPGGGTSGTWTTYSVTLDETDNWEKSGGGSVSQSDVQTVLGDLTELRIRGEYRSGSDKGYLDSVELNPP